MAVKRGDNHKRWGFSILKRDNELVSWERSLLAAVKEDRCVYGHEAEAVAQGVCVHLASQTAFQSQKPESASSDK